MTNQDLQSPDTTDVALEWKNPTPPRMFRIRPAVITGIELMRESSPIRFYSLIAWSIFDGLLPAATAIATGRLISKINPAVESGSLSSGAGRSLLISLGILAIVFSISQVAEPFVIAYHEGYRALVNSHRRERLMKATLAIPGIRHLEDPNYLDALRLATSREWPDPGSFTTGALAQLQSRVVSLTSAAVVGVSFNWFAAIALYLSWSVAAYFFRQGQAEGFTLGSDELRRSTYFRGLGFDGGIAKESRIFGMKPWIIENFTSSWTNVMKGVWEKRRATTARRFIIAVIIIIVNGAVFYGLAIRASDGNISPGTMTTVGFAILSIAAVARMDETTMAISMGGACFPAIAEIERRATEANELRMTGSRSASGLPIQKIVFENVTFSYPGRTEKVFENLNVTITAGQSLGIVGSNGAGKTTLIKLLSRLYDPDSGRILVDGIDLKEIDPFEWQRRIAAVFQDFVHYHYSARDNVRFGHIETVPTDAQLDHVAELVGAHGIINDLPNKWDTLLSRRYGGGTELSGGQWQRIALARALWAVEGGAGVLVLDEPTANLDARSEVLLFDRFLEVTQGSTAVLISHRFSTVRRADRIVVIDRGAVIEEGNHDELIALGGRYADSFNLQAGRYEELTDISEELIEETTEESEASI